ncbi:MAG: hypothetical protein FJ279_01525 [Planctomycetes bacterium]|nr:hypothetical protein [Planctomycetota bacterium]
MALGDSAKSVRLITDALQDLAKENLIEIKGRDCASHSITLTDHHQSYYDAILHSEFSMAQNEGKGAAGIGDDEKAMAFRERDKEKINGIEGAFSDDDFRLND